jgi:hypothetical protein
LSVPSTGRSAPQGGINSRLPEGPGQLGALFLLLLLGKLSVNRRQFCMPTKEEDKSITILQFNAYLIVHFFTYLKKRTNFIGILLTNNIAKLKANSNPHTFSDNCTLTKKELPIRDKE